VGRAPPRGRQAAPTVSSRACRSTPPVSRPQPGPVPGRPVRSRPRWTRASRPLRGKARPRFVGPPRSFAGRLDLEEERPRYCDAAETSVSGHRPSEGKAACLQCSGLLAAVPSTSRRLGGRRRQRPALKAAARRRRYKHPGAPRAGGDATRPGSQARLAFPPVAVTWTGISPSWFASPIRVRMPYPRW
jgi:hypothetical protein